MRLGILTTHPIQYQAPWFRTLASQPNLDVEVLFCHYATPEEQAAAGFGVPFDWDVPLLAGYAYRFLKNVARTPSVLTFNGLDTPEIAEVIAQGGYDAFLVNGWHYKSAWQAICACWRTKTPVMVRGDSQLLTRRSLWKRALKWPLYRWFIPRIDACLAVGQRSREYFLHYGARPDRVFLVPHVVDEERLRREVKRLTDRRMGLRRKWGLKEEAVVFLFVGKFTDKKRPLDFVQAVDRAARKGAPVVGLMVGDGPLRAECEGFVRWRNVPVRFTGFLNQSQIVQAYVVADTLVLPSDGGETWGMAVQEAMACGRPAIVSDRVGCAPDLIIPGVTGEVFPMGDIEALTEALCASAADPSRLREMGERAQERVSQGYSVWRAVEGVLEALEAVCKTPEGKVRS